MTSKENCKDNPQLLEDDKENLLEPGWAGEITEAELEYIKSKLKQSSSLRRRWSFRPTSKRFNDDHIRAIAMDGLVEKK